MTARRWLGLTLLVAVVAVVVVGCANRDGLRVEGTTGSQSPKSVEGFSTPPPTKAPRTAAVPAKEPTDKPKIGIPGTSPRSIKLNPAQHRRLLLASANVNPDAKSVLRTCPARCLMLGPASDLVGSGMAQRVVTVRVLSTGSVFVAYLVGDVEGARVLSTIRGQDMRITVGKGRTLVVASKVYGPTDKACCPSGSKVEIYRWNGNYLVRTSEVFTKGT